MAKTTTKKKSPKKASEKAAAKKSTALKTDVAIEPAETARETKAAKKAVKERTRDPRLPAPGTVIQKKSRGTVRCECTVLEDGIEYKGQKYRTLSGAAKAAAADVGIPGSSFNGFLFWQIIKPALRGADPVESLKKAWERYESRAGVLTGAGLTDDQRLRAVEAIEWHAEVIAELRGKLQTVGA